MTDTLPAWRRLTHAMVISLLLHLLAFVSIVSGFGGKPGTFSLPGVMLVELIPAGGSASQLNSAPEVTPFPAEPELADGAAPGPAPSLDNSAANGSERQPATPIDNSEITSDTDHPGFEQANPSINLRRPPAVSPITPPTGGPGTARPSPVQPGAPPATEANPTARCANCPLPPYPELALRRGIEGEVTLSVQVLADGRVGDIFVLKSSGFPFLDDAALNAVKSWIFFPATDENGPLASSIVYPVRFSLTEP